MAKLIVVLSLLFAGASAMGIYGGCSPCADVITLDQTTALPINLLADTCYVIDGTVEVDGFVATVISEGADCVKITIPSAMRLGGILAHFPRPSLPRAPRNADAARAGPRRRQRGDHQQRRAEEHHRAPPASVALLRSLRALITTTSRRSRPHQLERRSRTPALHLSRLAMSISPRPPASPALEGLDASFARRSIRLPISR